MLHAITHAHLTFLLALKSKKHRNCSRDTQSYTRSTSTWHTRILTGSTRAELTCNSHSNKSLTYYAKSLIPTGIPFPTHHTRMEQATTIHQKKTKKQCKPSQTIYTKPSLTKIKTMPPRPSPPPPTLCHGIPVTILHAWRALASALCIDVRLSVCVPVRSCVLTSRGNIWSTMGMICQGWITSLHNRTLCSNRIEKNHVKTLN